MTKKLLITGLISLWTCLAFAQDNNKKYWLSGTRGLTERRNTGIGTSLGYSVRWIHKRRDVEAY